MFGYIKHLFASTISVLQTSTTEMSLWQELWSYVQERYFSVDLGDYRHLNLGTGSLLSLTNVVLGIFIGIIIAAGFACYDKNKLGDFVRKLVREDCLSPDRAKTLAELGYEKARGTGIRGSLKHGSVLRRVVHCVEKEEFEAGVEAARAAYIEENGTDKGFEAPLFVLDFDLAHFYIPDEEHYAAEVRFEQKGSGWRAFLLVCLVSVICAALVCFLLPDMLQMVDNMLGILKGDGGVVNG